MKIIIIFVESFWAVWTGLKVVKNKKWLVMLNILWGAE